MIDISVHLAEGINFADGVSLNVGLQPWGHRGSRVMSRTAMDAIMKVIMVFAVTLVLPILSTASPGGCLDFSGSYLAAESTEADMVIYRYNQKACDALSVSYQVQSPLPGGRVSVNVFSGGEYRLDGSFPLSCDWAPPSLCGAYKMTKQALVKTLPSPQKVNVPSYGECFYQLSYLIKDDKGNLVETMSDAVCNGVYKGSVVRVFNAID